MTNGVFVRMAIIEAVLKVAELNKITDNSLKGKEEDRDSYMESDFLLRNYDKIGLV